MKPRTTDHRGKRVSLIHPQALRDAGLDTKRIDIPDDGHTGQGSFLSAPMHWTVIFWLGAVFALNIGSQVIASHFSLNQWVVFGPVAFVVLAALWFVQKLGGTWWDHVGPRFIHQIIGAGYCPSCAFPLADLVAEDDGCVVCPECGAAWRPGAQANEAGAA